MPRRVQQPKAKVVLRCSKEGCEYTASHKRYLDAHEARYTPPPPPPSDLPHPCCIVENLLGRAGGVRALSGIWV